VHRRCNAALLESMARSLQPFEIGFVDSSLQFPPSERAPAGIGFLHACSAIAWSLAMV
jgi:hypothetical protein